MNRRSRRSAYVSCSRCRSRERSTKAEGWNVTMKSGRPVGFICPSCQTTEEDLEAQINEATIDYRRAKLNPFGMVVAPAKGEALGDA